MPQAMTGVGPCSQSPTSAKSADSNPARSSPPMPLSDPVCASTVPLADIAQARRFDVPQSTAIHAGVIGAVIEAS